MPHTPLRVSVVCGGAGAEREISLKSGRAMARALRDGPRPCEVSLVELFDLEAPFDERVLEADVTLLALHGGPGEDGSLQQRLEDAGVPYLGSGPAASHLAMDKHASKERLRAAGLPTPDSVLVRRGDDVSPDDLALRLGLPLFAKPVAEGSSVGIRKVRSRDELAAAVVERLSLEGAVLLEQAVRGRELTVGILDDEPLPTLEIEFDGDFFDFEAKYEAETTRYFLEQDLDAAAAAEVSRVALESALVHGTQHLARVDLIHDGERPWVLELNTLPGMTERSLLPKAAAAAGVPFPMLCSRLVDMVLRDRGRARPYQPLSGADTEAREQGEQEVA